MAEKVSFERWWRENRNSRLMPMLLAMGNEPCPCPCGEDDCRGWQMMTAPERERYGVQPVPLEQRELRG